eukprot:TRINITY_DN12809_c0_g1_i1.p1 TRINITY_DN12809_c0_g1~~TRINITY_DN12809_c0_g1_i1.p1  ORF type:complete len:274 (+),score=54.50 TRINITY_DN12809_c0_g1_i1:46-822(+)
MEPAPENVIEVKDLTYKYSGEDYIVLRDTNLVLPKGSRCLLVGTNGAGKSTLLRILGGKHMHARNDVLVLGKSAFFETPSTLAYLGSDWRKSVAAVSNNIGYHADISVADMIKVMDTPDLERKQELLELLEIDLDWRMHKISDGETRRVQILMALLKPFNILLLDEITVDLDVLTRINLLAFFKKESERGCTILYATHIFDGLNGWPTHIVHVSCGELRLYDATKIEGPVYLRVAEWMRGDKEKQKALLQQNGRDWRK